MPKHALRCAGRPLPSVCLLLASTTTAKVSARGPAPGGGGGIEFAEWVANCGKKQDSRRLDQGPEPETTRAPSFFSCRQLVIAFPRFMPLIFRDRCALAPANIGIPNRRTRRWVSMNQITVKAGAVMSVVGAATMEHNTGCFTFACKESTGRDSTAG